MRGQGGFVGSQPMSTAVHITWHGAQINFGDLAPYLTYARVPCPHLKVFEAQLRGSNELVRSIVLVKNLHLDIWEKKELDKFIILFFGIMEEKKLLGCVLKQKAGFPRKAE